MDTLSRLSDLTAAQRDRMAATDFMCWLSCKSATKGAVSSALDMFEARWPAAPFATTTRLEKKAAVAVGTTTDPAWAKPLLAPSAAPMLAMVQQESLLGRVPFYKAPFNVPVPVQTSLGTFAWVGQNSPKPVTKFDRTSVTLPVGKVAGIVVLAEELVKLSETSSEDVMRVALIGGIVAFLDKQLLDPTVAAVAGKNPASLTNGVVPIAAGTSLPADVQKLLSALYTAGPNTQRPVLTATPAVVSALAGSAFTVVNNQLHYAGVPLFASPQAGNQVVAVDAAGVATATGELTVDISHEAVVQIDSAPDSPPTEATAFVSFWQQNLAGFLFDKQIDHATYERHRNDLRERMTLATVELENVRSAELDVETLLRFSEKRSLQRCAAVDGGCP